MAALKAELVKMKHSPWWLLFLILPCMPAAMGTVNYQNNLEVLKSGWYSLWTQETLFYTNFFFGPMIGLCCAYQWRMEHKGKNWNQLLTMPEKRWRLFGAKILVAFFVTLLTQFWVLVLFTVTGKMVHLSGMIPADILYWFLRGTLGGLVIATLQSMLSMKIRNFSVPIVIALMGSILGLLISNKGKGIFWPYSLMLVGMNANKSEDMLSGNAVTFYVSCILFFFLFFILSVTVMKHQAEKE